MDSGEVRVNGVRRTTVDGAQLAQAVLAVLTAQRKRNEPEWSDTKSEPAQEAK